MHDDMMRNILRLKYSKQNKSLFWFPNGNKGQDDDSSLLIKQTKPTS